MARFELVMPKMGESITEATVLKWLKQTGDQVARDEAVLEIATDKVDSEVPTPVGGRLVEVLHAEGAVVKVGAVLAILEDASESTTPSAPLATVAAPSAATTMPVASASAAQSTLPAAPTAPSPTEVPYVPAPVPVLNPGSPAPQPPTGRFYSPLVLSIARQENLPMAELDAIPGTGDQGRLTKKDLLNYLSNGRQAAQAVAQVPSPSQPSNPPISPSTLAAVSALPEEISVRGMVDREENGGSVEIIEMDRMRKLIAENMVASKRISAHVTSFVEADVTNLHYWREEHKAEFEKRFNEKLTFTPMFVEAVVKAIQDYPMINISVDGTRILKHKEIHIGMAAALPSGNLIVPVIHHADQLNLVGLTKRVNDLARRARTGKLKPEEIQGGTFTLSNVGTFGNVMGTPIIAQPQVAILAVGAVRKRPAVIETPQGDFIGIRHMMFLSHSYDHRVVDGALGGMFVKRVAEYLEKWDPSRGI
ncbi:MAG: 2-oxo acid dehydrogenase subunit E2 [Bacteroidetes bacterium]|jgi:2-oxoglutarate dehydrogenase E2 component (dihydrolipoamide succinyltransferase)|nr:2-oxo acid dehydrogenase subunit E2 [Bacteroidota bacterium]